MADIANQNTDLILSGQEQGTIQSPQFSIIVPQPFSLARHSESDLSKITQEVMEKEKSWESAMSQFFQEWQEGANSWRMIPKKITKKPRGLFNSKSGETKRAVDTLASLWFRMLTASDPYFEPYAQGLSETGQELTEEDLYAVRAVIMRQLDFLKFKPKLLKALRSLALFGTAIVEEPFISMPLGSPSKYFEGTDFMFRSLLQTFFDPYVFDLDFTDFIGTIDYPTKWKLREFSESNSETWNKEAIEKAIENKAGSSQHSAESYARVFERKQRAGYQTRDQEVFELINYHGKLSLDNSIFEDYWQSEGRLDDIRFTDWTVGLLDGQTVVRFHATPFGSWRHNFKVAHYNQFELEPLGYGVAKIGKRQQRELDFTLSRAQDALTMAIYAMWKVGKYAGLKSSQLTISPFNLVELEDVNQLEQLKMDVNSIAQAMNLQAMTKEDFRTTTGATTNLQAQATGATATEASLTQSEAIRGASVQAEIVAETFMREHLETMHINNTHLLDSEIWVAISGKTENFSVGMNRKNLPKNIGFRVRVTTDKDFRPERIKKLLELIQVATSVRQIVPESMNIVGPLFAEAFRMVGLDPAMLRRPKPVADMLSERLQRMGKANALGAGAEVEGEIAGEAAGSPTVSTPVGEVPTSPVGASQEMAVV